MRIAALIVLLLVACSPSEDDNLVAMLNRDIPALQDADDFTKLTLLMDWTANTVDLEGIPGDWTNQIVQASAGETYRDLWLPDAGGASCGGFAVFFEKLVELFGFTAYTMDMGFPGTLLTHVTTLVEVDGKLYVFDPTFNVRYLRPDGSPASLEDMREAVPESRPVRRTVLLPEPDKEVPCTEKDGYFVCPGIDTNARLMKVWGLLLIEHGLDPDGDPVAMLLRHPISAPEVVMKALAR